MQCQCTFADKTWIHRLVEVSIFITFMDSS